VAFPQSRFERGEDVGSARQPSTWEKCPLKSFQRLRIVARASRHRWLKRASSNGALTHAPLGDALDGAARQCHRAFSVMIVPKSATDARDT